MAALGIWVALMAPGAHAGLDLSWNACGKGGGVAATRLGCAQPDSVARLFGCIQIPDTLPRFFSMDVVLEVRSESGALPPFWHFERAGCNRAGVVLSHTLPRSGCTDAPSPWGSPTFSIAGGVPTEEEASVRRLHGAIARPRSQPTPLTPGQNYFAFELQFFSDAARESGGNCEGCAAPVVIRWVSSTLHSAPENAGDPAPPPLVVSGPGLGTDCVRVNGAGSAGCEPSPTAPGARDSLDRGRH